jgi:parvulin-like peptidyl-prolyl isomerase
MFHPCAFVAIFLCLLTVASVAPSQEPAQAAALNSAPVVVVARVAGKPIYLAEVKEELDGVLKGRVVEPDTRPRLEAEMLDQLVDRRLVLESLRSRSQAASERDVDFQAAQLAKQARQHGTTLAAFLASRGLTEEALKEQLAWRLSWKSYVERHVNDDMLERYFNAHRRNYDGTQVHARQILLPFRKGADAAAVAGIKKQAAELRTQIADGKIKFAEAAASHSAAPSKDKGGDLGWIARHGSVPEAVAAAAFALEAGKVSEPVVTSFGVHLVEVTEVKPGTKTWRDVASELQSTVVRRGFNKIATEQRPKTAIEFTGAAPYFDPSSGKLVEKK